MRRLALALLGVICAAVFWQATVDAQWRFQGQIGGSRQLARTLSVSVAERCVFGDRVANTGRYRTMLAVTASPTRYLDYTVGYQLFVEEDARNPWFRHRVHADLGLKWSLERLELSYRGRWQASFNEAHDFASVIRTRAQARIDLPWHLRAAASGELFSAYQGEALSAFRLELTAALRLSALVRRRHRDVAPATLTLGYRYHTPWQGGGKSYNMVLAALTWSW